MEASAWDAQGLPLLAKPAPRQSYTKPPLAGKPAPSSHEPPRQWEICPEMHALAKMAEMAPNCQNRQTVNKNSNEMAKGPFGKWRFWQKWRIKSPEAGNFLPFSPLHAFLAIFAKIANFATIAIFTKIASLQGSGTFIATIASPLAIFAKIANFAKIASLQGATFGIQFKSPAAGDFSPVSPLHAFLDISGQWDQAPVTLLLG